MGILFWILIRTIIFTVIGNTFYKWFATTKIGKKFDTIVAKLLNKITQKEESVKNGENKDD